jgi:hypothetical protein
MKNNNYLSKAYIAISAGLIGDKIGSICIISSADVAEKYPKQRNYESMTH